LQRYIEIDFIPFWSKINSSIGILRKAFGHPMHMAVKGVCLIIDVKNFTRGRGLTERIGADIDVASIRHVFSMLRFKVILCCDLTARQMEKAVNEGLFLFTVF
jgi:hypothetical protein